jgi:Protein of unknown function (DUF2917)
MATVISHLPSRHGAGFTASATHFGAQRKEITMLSIRLFRAWLRAHNPAFVAPHPSATASATPASPSRDVQAVHQLPQAHTMTLAEPLGHALVCLAGCIWITQDGDPRDVVINAGQVFTPDRNRRTLIHALEASQVRVA